MWSTIFCPLGLAEAMVHEMAHQKLRALGVSFESAAAVVGNDPSDLYISPIIKDRLRPMTAVMHAEYSYVHVTALDIHLLRAERDPARRAVLREVLARNLARIEEGIACIRTHLRPGDHGPEFMEGFYDWAERTVREAHELLARADEAVAAPPVVETVRSERAAPEPASVEPAQPEPAESAPAAAQLPDIDTRANTIATPDRLVDVLLACDSPRLVVLGNVLSHEECDALIDYCEPRLGRSSVVGDAEGNVQVHQTRTSRDVGVRRDETALIARIEARLAALLRWPAECSEGLQVVRYGVGDEYRPHFDWIDPDVPGLAKHLAAGGQRLATLILYLNDVAAGGATSFPAAGLTVGPKRGNALYFRNVDAHGVPDQRSLHAGDPVRQGVKFVANKWLRQSVFPG
jgi:prolyl 4-hydroxylase